MNVDIPVKGKIAWKIGRRPIQLSRLKPQRPQVQA